MTATTRRRLSLALALALVAITLGARLLLHPHTPYKSFLFSAAPVAALWLAVWVGLGFRPAHRRLRGILVLTAIASLASVTAWCFLRRPEILPPLSVDWAGPALIGAWLVALTAVAAGSGKLTPYFRPGPMSALGTAAIVYALATGFLPLPFGAGMMTAGLIWVAIWQGVYLYKVRM